MYTVVIDARMIKSSGIGRYLHFLVQGLLTESDISLILLGNEKELNVQYNAKVINLSIPVYHPLESFVIAKKLKEIEDVALFFTPHFNTPICKINAKWRIATIHDLFHISEYSNLFSLRKIYARFLLRSTIRRSDRLINVSNFTHQEIQRLLKLDPPQVDIIYNAIDKESIVSLLAQRATGRMHSRNYFLFVGNLKSHKNIENIVKAFELADVDADLLLIGKSFDNQNRLHLDNFSGGDKQVMLKGAVSDKELYAFYQDAVCLIFPSYYEGFGLPPLEAACCGTPAILSNIPIFTEIYGEHYNFVDPYSVSELKNVMESFFKSHSVREKSVSQILCNETFFDVNRFVYEHLSVFKNQLKTVL